jgi:phosphate transport system protein
MVVRTAEISRLKDLILTMTALVEEAIGASVASLVDRDTQMAEGVIKGDKRINDLDVKIEEECIRLIALYQPMATDLRFITTALKITSDLERIADNAVNVAERALELNQEPPLKPYVDIPHMGRIARGMVRDAIDAFINRDKRMAMDVIMRDAEVDDLNDAVTEELMSIMARNPETVRRGTRVTYVSKYVERMGDHATNIAEMVIYLVEGRIVRHQDIKKLI